MTVGRSRRLLKILHAAQQVVKVLLQLCLSNVRISSVLLPLSRHATSSIGLYERRACAHDVVVDKLAIDVDELIAASDGRE